MKSIRTVIFLALNVFLTGCAMFKAEMPSVILQANDIDVLVDVLSVHDIDGSIDGIYIDESNILQTAISNDINRIMRKKINIASITTSSGIIRENEHLVYAKDDRSTGDTFTNFHSEKGKNILTEAKFIPLYKEIIKKGKGAGRDGITFDINAPMYEPDTMSRYLLFVQASSRYVPMGKSLAIGIASGLVAGVSVMPASGGIARVALIDLKNEKVIWYVHRAFNKHHKFQIATKKIIQVLNRNITPFTNSNVTEGTIPLPTQPLEFASVYDAKIAFRRGDMVKDKLVDILNKMKTNHEHAITSLKNKKDEGSISEPAFEALSMQAINNYTGP